MQDTNISNHINEQAAVAFKHFRTPQHRELRERERILEEQATKFIIGDNLQGYSWGEGPIVLLVHGWEGRALSMSGFVDPLRQAGWKVVAFDAPAHGKSPGEQTDPMDYALKLVNVGANLGHIAGIIGHSMGAASTAIAISLGLDVERAILIASPSSLVQFPLLYASVVGLSPEVKDRFIAMFEETYPQLQISSLQAANLCRTFTQPALVFHDPEDTEISFEDGQSIAANWPNARMIVVTGRGHRRILLDADVIATSITFLGIEGKSEQ